MVTLANGTTERRASETMLKAKAKEAGRRITVGEDKAYDTADLDRPWPAWSPSPTGLPSVALRRQCSRPKPRRRAAASRLAKTRPMTRPILIGRGRHGHPRQRDYRASRFGDNAQGQSQGGGPPHHGWRRQGL